MKRAPRWLIWLLPLISLVRFTWASAFEPFGMLAPIGFLFLIWISLLIPLVKFSVERKALRYIAPLLSFPIAIGAYWFCSYIGEQLERAAVNVWQQPLNRLADAVEGNQKLARPVRIGPFAFDEVIHTDEGVSLFFRGGNGQRILGRYMHPKSDEDVFTTYTRMSGDWFDVFSSS